MYPIDHGYRLDFNCNMALRKGRKIEDEEKMFKDLTGGKISLDDNFNLRYGKPVKKAKHAAC